MTVNYKLGEHVISLDLEGDTLVGSEEILLEFLLK